jgi:hypothetical protein
MDISMELPKELEEKLCTWIGQMSRKTPVSVVTGIKGLIKDTFLNRMVRAFLLLKVSYSTYTPILLYQAIEAGEVKPAFLYVLYDGEMVTGYKINEVKSFLMEHVRMEKPVIIDCPSMEELEGKYGKDFIDFISSRMIEVSLPITRQEYFSI